VKRGGCLIPMTTSSEVEKLRAAVGAEFSWSDSVALPGGEDRVLAQARRTVNSPI
jgi:hypothetical protein